MVNLPLGEPLGRFRPDRPCWFHLQWGRFPANSPHQCHLQCSSCLLQWWHPGRSVLLQLPGRNLHKAQIIRAKQAFENHELENLGRMNWKVIQNSFEEGFQILPGYCRGRPTWFCDICVFPCLRIWFISPRLCVLPLCQQEACHSLASISRDTRNPCCNQLGPTSTIPRKNIRKGTLWQNCGGIYLKTLENTCWTILITVYCICICTFNICIISFNQYHIISHHIILIYHIAY